MSNSWYVRNLERITESRHYRSVGKTMAIAGLAFLFCCQGKAFATGPFELNIQGATAFGGDATTVRGQAGGVVPFSVMGRLRDIIRIYDRNGNVVLYGELGFFASSPEVFRERANVKYPDGQTRIWLRIFNTPRSLHGGWMTLHSANGMLLDLDPIQLR
jgi:hypothetical protein